MKNMKKHNQEMRASEYLEQQMIKSTICAVILAILFCGLSVLAFSKIPNDPLKTNVYQGVSK